MPWDLTALHRTFRLSTVLHCSSMIGKDRLRIFALTLLTIIFLTAPAWAEVSYVVTDLGTLSGGWGISRAWAINNSGQIAGESQRVGDAGYMHPILYSGGQMIDLGSLGGTAQSYAFGVNDVGQVVGSSFLEGNYTTHAFLYSDSHMADLGSLGGGLSEGSAINKSGQVTGYSNPTWGGYHAFIYNNGQMTDIGSLAGQYGYSYGEGINNYGHVAGYSTPANGGRWHAFFYKEGQMVDIGTLGGSSSYAQGINDDGQIIGYSDIPGDATQHAFVYSNGQMTDIGTLGGSSSSANGLNETGQVVGISSITGDTATHAFLYSGGRMLDLNALAAGNMGGFSYLWIAQAINDKGQIVGGGFTTSGQQHAFLATPIGVATVDAGANVTISSDQVCATTITGSVTGTVADVNLEEYSYRWREGDTVLQTSTSLPSDGKATLPLCNLGLTRGQHTLILEVDDGTLHSDTMTLTIDNSAPVASPSGGGTYNYGDIITLGGTVADFDGDALTYTWLNGAQSLFVGSVQAVKDGTPVALPVNQLPSPNLGAGTKELTLQVSDGVSQPVTKTISVTVNPPAGDTTPPTLKPIAFPAILWPANNQMHWVIITANARDDSGGPVTLAATVKCNDPNCMTSDYTTPSIDQKCGLIWLQLRAVKVKKGPDRTYTITVKATDKAGNATSADVFVKVPSLP